MNKLSLLAALGLTMAAGTVSAADLIKKEPPPPPPPSTDGFDYAFGVKIQSDYISRGITQSNHRPSATVYGELRYNIGDTQLYAGVQPWSVDLPTQPLAEVDLYGGIRQTFDKLVVDVGAIYYFYPNNQRQYFTNGTPGFIGGQTALVNFPGAFPTTAKDPSYFEGYIKPVYTINDIFTIGANVYASPNWNNYRGNAYEVYVSGTVKINVPQIAGLSVSGEFGHEFLNRPNAAAFGSFKFPDYNTYNVGVSYVYQQATFDLRYYGTDLSKTNAYIDSSDPHGNPVGGVFNGRSNWGGQRIVASLSLDFTSKDLAPPPPVVKARY